MIFNRYCLALLVVGCCCTQLAAVEDLPPLDSQGTSPRTGGVSGTSRGTSDGGQTPPSKDGKRHVDVPDYRTGEIRLRDQATGTIVDTGGTSGTSRATSDDKQTPPSKGGKRHTGVPDYRTGELHLRDQATGTVVGTGGTSGTSPGADDGGETPPGTDGTGTMPGTDGTGTTKAAGASSSFSSKILNAGAGAYGSGAAIPFAPEQGGSSTGAEFDVSKSKPTSFAVEGFYGQGRKTFTTGEGRLAKPHLQTSFSLSTGYDDNYESAPGGGAPRKVPNGTFDVIPGVPAGSPIIKNKLVFLGGGLLGVRPVLVGFTKTAKPDRIIPHFDTLPPLERRGSFTTRGNIGFDVQASTRRWLLTLAASGGTTYYWNKPKDPFDHHGGVSGIIQYKFTPRLRVTEQMDATYTTQPDLARLNTPDRPTLGPYLSLLSRTDIKYRYTSRLSTTGTLSYDAIRYSDSTEQAQAHSGITLGLQAEYLWSPHSTFITELRRNVTSYPDQAMRDSTTDYFLVGADFNYSIRLDGTLRFGATRETFDAGNAKMSPYLETSLNYRATSRSELLWTNRFGFEEPDATNEQRQVFRTGLHYTYSFSSRLRGSIGVNLVHERLTTLVGNSGSSLDLTYDSTLSLGYTVSRHFSLNLSYSFTDVESDQELRSYYRNQVFFGGNYQF